MCMHARTHGCLDLKGGREGGREGRGREGREGREGAREGGREGGREGREGGGDLTNQQTQHHATCKRQANRTNGWTEDSMDDWSREAMCGPCANSCVSCCHYVCSQFSLFVYMKPDLAISMLRNDNPQYFASSLEDIGSLDFAPRRFLTCSERSLQA